MKFSPDGNSAKGMFYKALLMAGSPIISAFVKESAVVSEVSVCHLC